MLANNALSAWSQAIEVQSPTNAIDTYCQLQWRPAIPGRQAVAMVDA